MRYPIAPQRPHYYIYIYAVLKLPPPGIEPGTFRSSVWRSPSWAIAAGHIWLWNIIHGRGQKVGRWHRVYGCNPKQRAMAECLDGENMHTVIILLIGTWVGDRQFQIWIVCQYWIFTFTILTWTFSTCVSFSFCDSIPVVYNIHTHTIIIARLLG